MMRQNAQGQAAPVTAEQIERNIERAVENAVRASQNGADRALQPATPPAPPAPPRAPGEDGVVIVPPQSGPRGGLSPEAARELTQGFQETIIPVVIMLALVLFTYPWMRALARRWENRSAPPATLPPQALDQLHRIEHTVEAMQIELERVAEAQRFLTRLQSEREAVRLPADRS